MEVKKTYGSLGIGTFLANFQPVLRKIFYHADLKDLAKASGFRGETLTSLEKCSNFERTHLFLKFNAYDMDKSVKLFFLDFY